MLITLLKNVIYIHLIEHYKLFDKKKRVQHFNYVVEVKLFIFVIILIITNSCVNFYKSTNILKNTLITLLTQ